MQPKKSLQINDLKYNQATISPEFRRVYRTIWDGKLPPLQLLKGLAWVAQFKDSYTPDAADLQNQTLTPSSFAKGVALPPSYGIKFDTTGSALGIYNSYGNVDYKTIGSLILAISCQHRPLRTWLNEQLPDIYPKGLASFEAESLKALDFVKTRGEVDSFMRVFLDHLGNTVNGTTINVYAGAIPAPRFETDNGFDSNLADILNNKFGITGLEKTNFKGPNLGELILNLKLGLNSLAVGPTGTGKSECVLEAFRLADPDKDVQIIEGHESLREIDLLGGWTPAARGVFNWADGVLVTAMRNGSYLFVDEANRMPTRTLNVLLGVLSRGAVVLTDHGSEHVHCEDGFTVVMAMNQGQGYTVNSLDRALVDRFPTAMEFHYLESKDEIDLVVERTGLDRKLAKMMVHIANEVRELARVGEFEAGMSPRGLFAWATKYQALVDAKEPVNRAALVLTAEQTWIRAVAGVGVDGYMEREVVNKLSAMIHDVRA